MLYRRKCFSLISSRGQLICGVSLQDKKEQLASAIRQIFEGLSQDLQEKATRNSMEISDDEKNQDRAMMVELAKVLMQVKQDVEAQNAGGSTPLGRRRRKRATGSYQKKES